MGGAGGHQRSAAPATKSQATKGSISYNSMHKHTAVTITLNTVPWKKLTSAHNYMCIINKVKQLANGTVDWKTVGWELNGNCQLHCHFTLISKKPVVIAKIINQLKAQKHYWKYHSIDNFANYRLHFKPLKTTSDIERWTGYCLKAGDQRPFYNRVAHDISNKLLPDLDLTDYDIEFIGGNPKFIDGDKAFFIF